MSSACSKCCCPSLNLSWFWVFLIKHSEFLEFLLHFELWLLFKVHRANPCMLLYIYPCVFALCVCVYVGCVSSCVLFFSCFILYSPRLSYLSMLSQSVMPCLSCLRLSLPCALSCSFAPSRLPFVHSCVMFLSFLFYWESLVIPCTVCFPCGIMLICVTCVP